MTAAGTRPGGLPGPRGIDNLRRLRSLFSDLQPALDELHATYGPICELGGPGLRVVVVGDPTLVHHLFSMKAESFRWGHRFNVVGVRFVVGKRSMIVSDGDDHGRRRGAVQRAFTPPRLRRWMPMIVDRTDAAIDRVVAGLADATPGRSTDSFPTGVHPTGVHPTGVHPTGVHPTDLYPVGRHLILGVTLHAFFGERLAAHVDEFSDLFLRAQSFIEAPAPQQLPHPIPFTKRAKVRADRRRIDRIIDAEVADRRANPTGDPFDVLEVLATDSSLSDAEIRDQVDTLIGAGYDTTASTFAWLLWRAVLDPNVWARLRAEADEVLGPPSAPGRAPDSATLAALRYAQRVVHESLRLHPAGLIGARVAARPLRLGDHAIRKGTLIAWSPHLVGRDPGTWPDPTAFDPDRHLDLTDAQKAIDDRAWIPFGRGPHMCLGFALAQMELTLMIARFAQRLDLTAVSVTVPRARGMVVNRPVGGAPFHVRARRAGSTGTPTA